IASGGSLNISSTTLKAFNGHTLNNSGTVTWTGTGDIRVDTAPSVVNNQSGGVFNAQNNSVSGLFNNGSTLTFNNQSGATFNKSGAGTTSPFSVAFNNDLQGTVNVASGVLVLAAGGTSGGAFSVSGGTLVFSGGMHNLTATSSITGAGD